jgi:translation initiation factor 1
MAKKNKPDTRGFVYSTNPNFHFEEEKGNNETIPANKQQLKIRTDTGMRGGKIVTLIQGFAGKTEDLEEMGKQLKNFCGTGGSVKEGYIIIQGDQRDKVMQWMGKNGYVKAKIF